MKIAAIHTDFRIYWPARLNALSQNLHLSGHELFVIEIAGKGSPYHFAEKNDPFAKNWTCLFPEEKMEALPSPKIKEILWKKLDELNPDVLLAGAIAFPSGAISVQWAKAHNKGVVIFDDARLEDVPRSFAVNFVKKKFYQHVDAIFCPAAGWNQTFFHWGFKPEQIFYGVDVVDNEFWKVNESQEIKLPKRYILSVGRLIEIKNFPFVLKAFELYKEKTGEDISLLFVGDGPVRSVLEEQMKDEFRDSVQFFPFLSPKDLRYVYQHAELLVLASHRETWGLVVNEAMASGLPAAISNQTGCAEVLVKTGVNGYVFAPDNVSELVSVFETYFSLSEQKKNEMKRVALETVDQWGLTKFADGASKAILYAGKNKKPANMLNRKIMSLWNGRYNPI